MNEDYTDFTIAARKPFDGTTYSGRTEGWYTAR